MWQCGLVEVTDEYSQYTALLAPGNEIVTIKNHIIKHVDSDPVGPILKIVNSASEQEYYTNSLMGMSCTLKVVKEKAHDTAVAAALDGGSWYTGISALLKGQNIYNPVYTHQRYKRYGLPDPQPYKQAPGKSIFDKDGGFAGSLAAAFGNHPRVVPAASEEAMTEHTGSYVKLPADFS